MKCTNADPKSTFWRSPGGSTLDKGDEHWKAVSPVFLSLQRQENRAGQDVVIVGSRGTHFRDEASQCLSGLGGQFTNLQSENQC